MVPKDAHAMTERHVHTPVAAVDHIDTTLELIERAQSLEYDRAWVPETWGRDAIATLAAASRSTSTIGLGTSIVNVFSRSPALLGQSAATLDELAPGRFRLGIGPSGPALIEGWHGASYDRPLRRTRESAEIIRQVLDGDVVSYDGDIFQVDGFRLRFDRADRHIPIDLAGLGPKSVELAGFAGDGWHAMLATPDGLRAQLDHLATGAAKANRSVADCDVTLGVTCCALSDAERARRLAAGHIAFYTGAMGPFYGQALARQGFESVAKSVATAWQAGDRDSAIETVQTELLDEIAIAGDPETARSQLEQFTSIDGVDAVAVSFPRGAETDEVMSTLEALAPR